VLFEKKITRSQVIEKMVRPERFELPTFWFVAPSCQSRHTKPADNLLKTLEGNYGNCRWFRSESDPEPAQFTHRRYNRRMDVAGISDDFYRLLNAPVETAHEFEVELNCLVITNHKLTMEGIDRVERDEMADVEESFKDETDYEMVSSIRSARLQFYDDLRAAARNLTFVGLITRLQHWASAYARRIDPKREPGNSLKSDLNFLNAKLGAPRVATNFFCALAEVRNSVIHGNSVPQWSFNGKPRNVDTRYAPNGYRVEVSEEDLKEAIEKAITQIELYDEKLIAVHK
jgi:hypothetical protein